MRPRARLNKDTMIHLRNLPAGDQARLDAIIQDVRDVAPERFMASKSDPDECMGAHQELIDLLSEDQTPEKELRTIVLYGPDMAWHLMQLAMFHGIAHDPEYTPYVESYLHATSTTKRDYWQNECNAYVSETPQGQVLHDAAFEKAWDNVIDIDNHLKPLDTLAHEADKARSIRRSTASFAHLISRSSAINESPPFEHFQILLQGVQKELDDMIRVIDNASQLRADVPEETLALWGIAKSLLAQSKGAATELEARAKSHYREAQYGSQQQP